MANTHNVGDAFCIFHALKTFEESRLMETLTPDLLGLGPRSVYGGLIVDSGTDWFGVLNEYWEGGVLNHFAKRFKIRIYGNRFGP